MAFAYNEQGGGSAGSSGSTSKSTSQSGTLPWYNDFVKNLLGQGKNAMQPWEAYQGDRVAGFVPDQTRAFQNLRDAQGNWIPKMQAANTTTGAALTGLYTLRASPYTQGALNAWQQQQQQATYDQGQVGQFMNPYVNNVVNEVGRLGNENFNNNILKGINDNFTGAGQFGSARQMNMTGQAAAKAQAEISAQQGSLLFGSQNEAMKNYSDWVNKGMEASQNQAQGNMGVNDFLLNVNNGLGQLGTQYAQLAGASQQLTANDYNNLYGAGQKQQEQAQRKLNAGYEAWNEKRNYPWMQLNNWSELFKVPTPQQSSSRSTSSSSSNQNNWNSGWNTSFKRGGLARVSRPRQMASGGGFSWQIDPEVQAERDAVRMQILLNELDSNPGDLNLITEIENMGGMAPVGARKAGSTWSYSPEAQDLPVVESLAPVREQPLQVAAMDNNIIGELLGQGLSSQQNPLSVDAYARRMGLLDQAQSSPAFAQRPAPSMPAQLGRAMMDSAAAGPAHWGQLLGRAGESFYDAQDKHQQGNDIRAAAQLSAMDKILPVLNGSAGRTASTSREPTPEQVRTVYSAARNEAAQIAKDYRFNSAEERSQWIEQRANDATQNYLERFATAPVGPRGFSSENAIEPTREMESVSSLNDVTDTNVRRPANSTSPQNDWSRGYGPIRAQPRDRIEEARLRSHATGTEDMDQEFYKEHVQRPAVAADGVARSMQMIRQVPRTQDALAPYREILGSALDVFGIDGRLAREAQNLQQVRPLLTTLANESLRKNTGVQTEGDAQRAFNEFLKITDTQEAADFMYAWTEENARRAKFKDELFRAGATEEKSWGAGQKMWEQSDYAQTAPLGFIDGELWTFTDWREEFLANNPDASISDVISVWNKILPRSNTR